MNLLKPKPAGFGLRDIMRGPNPAEERAVLENKMFHLQMLLTSVRTNIYQERNLNIPNQQKIAMLQAEQDVVYAELHDMAKQVAALPRPKLSRKLRVKLRQ